MNIPEFLGSTLRNAWVDHYPLHVYVRKSTRLNPNDPHGATNSFLAFDIANMNTPEEYRGQGAFWRMIELLQDILPEGYSAIYIENVLNPRFAASLRKKGLQEIPSDHPSFILWLR